MPPNELASPIVLDALKKNYFDTLRREKIGETPMITEKLDQLEIAIRNVQAVLAGGY